MSKDKKPSEKVAAVSKEVKEALQKLEKDIGNTLNELEKLKPKEQAERSIDQVRKVYEDRITQLRSSMEKYLSDTHIAGDVKSGFKRLGDQIPQLTAKLNESIEKQATSIYTGRIKVFSDDVKSLLRRLRQKIGY